ncbi:MAG: ABC transporter permease, partial [Gammaproteobacteria bacterium]
MKVKYFADTDTLYIEFRDTGIAETRVNATELNPTGMPSTADTARHMPCEQPTVTSRALADLSEGLAQWQLWALLGWQDILQRYRRSLLGPFWLTFSMAIMVIALGILYAKLFRIDIHDYLPFLTLGFLAWGLISGVITEGCTALTAAEPFIKQMKLPFSLHVHRVVWRNLIIFAHNLVVYIGVAIWFGIWPGAVALLLVPGIALILLNGIWVGLLFGMVCARFRDIPQIIASLLQVAFFLTPIIWRPELLGERAAFAHMNPFFHFVELIRAPLLGSAPSQLTWTVALITTLLG